MEHAEAAIKLLNPCDYNQRITLCEGIDVRFTDVGHLLGSAAIEVWITEENETRKVVFSGDVGNLNQPIIKDPTYVQEADYVVIESTYGDRTHGDDVPDYVGEFTRILRETFAKGGNVVIPSFAVGRTQEILYFIREIKEKDSYRNIRDLKYMWTVRLRLKRQVFFRKMYSPVLMRKQWRLCDRGLTRFSSRDFGLRLQVMSQR